MAASGHLLAESDVFRLADRGCNGIDINGAGFVEAQSAFIFRILSTECVQPLP